MKFILDNLYLIAIALGSGGMLIWPLLKRGGGSASVSPLQATQLINHRNAIVVDVRDEQAFAAGSVTGARNIPLAKLEQRMAELTRFKARPAIVVCESGQQSARALATLKAQGFEETHSLAGGLSAWKQAGLPLVQAIRDSGRPVQKDSAKNRAKSEARAYDKARAAAKEATRASPPASTRTSSRASPPASSAASSLVPPPDASALNGHPVLEEGDAKADAVRLDPANDASTPDRVKEAS